MFLIKKVIKVKLLDGSIKKFVVDDIYIKQVKLLEPCFYTEIQTKTFIGQNEKSSEKIYGEINEWVVDNATAYEIERDFPYVRKLVCKKVVRRRKK